MSLALPIPFGGPPVCRDCLEQGGARVLATRIMRSGPRCDMHYRKIAGMPPISPITFKEGKSVPKKAEVDWDEVQRDRDAGVPVAELVKKYGVSNPTIYTRTHASGKKSERTNERTNERSSRSKARAKRGGFNGRNASSPTLHSFANGGSGSSGMIGETLDKLRLERDRLDKAIEALEGLEA